MKFLDAFIVTQSWEGGSKVHTVPGDPGGTTKWGISQRAYPGVDIANLTFYEAAQIASRDYWRKLACDQLPHTFNWDVFDFGFNAGAKRSAEILQQALNICVLAEDQDGLLLSVDGQVGPKTIATSKAFPADRVRRIFRAYRADHYMALAETGRAQFIHGWLKRVEGGFNG